MYRELIVTLAARHRLPAVYAFRVYVAGSGLMFYGPNSTDPYRRAAGYMDRILKREKPGRSASPLRHPARRLEAGRDTAAGQRPTGRVLDFSDKQPAWGKLTLYMPSS
jgi:hypothetical protein